MKRLIITEEEKDRILSLHYDELYEHELARNTRQLRRDIRQDARQQIQTLNQASREQRQAERQAAQAEQQAQRELARTQREARRTARREARVDARNRKEMEQKLADFQNMIKLYGNSETFKPYLQEYNAAIKELQAQLRQQTTEVPQTGASGASPSVGGAQAGAQGGAQAGGQGLQAGAQAGGQAGAGAGATGTGAQPQYTGPMSATPDYTNMYQQPYQQK